MQKEKKPTNSVPNNGVAGGVYFLGFIGAAVYFIQEATGFWNGTVGLLKACVWPAFLIYEAMKFLNL